MELFCPECMGTLVPSRPDTLRCSVHGGEFEVLYARPGAIYTAGPAAIPGAGAVCARHPSAPAPYCCSRCGAHICQTCDFPMESGAHYCPDCAVGAPGAATVPVGQMCANHTSAPARCTCCSCGAPICETCTFTFPGNVFVCPGCAVKPRTAVSAGRKKMLIWSYALAIWCTLGLAVLLSGALAPFVETPEADAMFGVIFALLIFLPGLIGLGLSFSTREKNLPNPGAVWGAIVWNSIIAAILLLLTIIGNFMA